MPALTNWPPPTTTGGEEAANDKVRTHLRAARTVVARRCQRSSTKRCGPIAGFDLHDEEFDEAYPRMRHDRTGQERTHTQP